jgi:hypothetical protein
MHMKLPVRLVVAAALAGSACLAVVAPATIAGAKGVKPPVTATCTGLFGQEANQLQSGCTGSSTKAKVTSYGVSVPNSGDTGATVYWTNKDTTVLTFTYTSVTNTCPTYLGYAATLEEAETATVTGGNSGLTTGVASAPSNVCVYVDGSQILVNSAGSNSF